MAFRVEISPQAFEDLDGISAYIRHRGSSESAELWFNGIMAAIKTLRDAPQRCPLAEESRQLQAEVRLLLYGKRNRRYKIYYAIHKETETIRVFHVRHWAQKPADTGELDDLMENSAEISTRRRGGAEFHMEQSDSAFFLRVSAPEFTRRGRQALA